MLKKKQIFLVVILMFLVSALLMIAHNNAPKMLSAQFLWGPLLVITVLIFDTKAFFTKVVIINLLFVLLYGFILPVFVWSFMNDWYAFRQPLLFAQILYAIVLGKKLIKDKSVEKWSLFTKASLIFIVVTCVMTIVATEMEPLIVRASYSSGSENIDNFNYFKRLGIGSYGYMTALVVLVPTLISVIKAKEKRKGTRILFIGVLLLILITLLEAQIFANILVAGVFIIFSFFGLKNIKSSMLVFGLLIIIYFIIPNTVYSRFFNVSSGFFTEESNVYKKLDDLSGFIENPDMEDTSSGVSGRAQRYPMLWSVFKASPIFGDANYDSDFDYAMARGGHLFWMSRLALWGIIGFMGFIYLLYINFKQIYLIIPQYYRYYYLLSVLSFIILGLMKSINMLESALVLYVIIPGICIYANFGNGLNKLNSKTI